MTSPSIAIRRFFLFFCVFGMFFVYGLSTSTVWAQPDGRFWRIERFVIPGRATMPATRAQTFVGKLFEFAPNPTAARRIVFEGQTCAVSVIPRRFPAGPFFFNTYNISSRALQVDQQTQITVIETGCPLPGMERFIQVAPDRLMFMREGVFFFLVPAPAPAPLVPFPVPGMAYRSFPEIGLTVSFPPSVRVLPDGPGPRRGLGIRISVRPLASLTPGYGSFDDSRRVAREDRKSLQIGRFGHNPPFAVPTSQRVLPLSQGINTKVFTTLTRPDVCRVVFEKTAIFYRGNKQVRITLVAAPEAIILQSPVFFTRNPPQCGPKPVWDFPRNPTILEAFYNKTRAVQTGPAAADWQATFKTIIDSIRMTP